MSEQVKTKEFEIIECECGHECPVEFAKLTSDDVWVCPNCYIDIVNEKIANDSQTSKNSLNISDVSNCTSGKEKRYCKGCLCDVTDTMFCYCGEIPLTKESTYTDDDLKAMNV